MRRYRAFRLLLSVIHSAEWRVEYSLFEYNIEYSLLILVRIFSHAVSVDRSVLLQCVSLPAQQFESFWFLSLSSVDL